MAAQEDIGRSRSSSDALTAATCLATGLPICTRNPADFIGIESLEVVEVSD